ncbi:hypothetical protein MHU86_11767 [Fragilaria crotonensis]|nr:hypothetical protein MHU86_11767 [Fragilaria crotonensis]
MKNSARDKQEINSLKQLLHKTQLAHADTTAVWKHCKSDVKDEIFKKKACGHKLHASTIIVEELQAKFAALEGECNRDQSQTCAGVLEPLQDVVANKESEIDALMKNSARDKQEINSLKQLLHKTQLAHADTTAVWKHCKSDVKDEIFKKKACGDKLHASTIIVEELQAKVAALEGECNRDLVQACTSVLVPLQDVVASKESEMNSLKQVLRETQLAHADTTAVWKHCKSDVKDEIFKKKACGDKLHASTISVEELQAKVAALEEECKRNCTSAEEPVAVRKKRRNPFKFFFNWKRKFPAQVN